MRKPNQLDIAAATPQATSPEHKRFQTLLARIAKARERLAAWQAEAPRFAQAHTARCVPARQALAAQQRALAFELEALAGAQRFSRAEAGTLSAMICELAGTLLDAATEADGAEPDAELKALFNRHSEIDYDSENQQHLDGMKAMVEAMSGLDLGEHPVESAAELMRRAHEQMMGKLEAEVSDGQSAQQAGGRRSRKPPRKTAAQKRADEDAARASQTVREVYRKLASALHPDRAGPDSVAADREARTALMQRANAAYEAGDLLALLELQLQIEQVDIAHAAGIAAEQVRHFNRVLAEQLRELEQEIDDRQAAFCDGFGIEARKRIDPAELGKLLSARLRAIEARRMVIEHDRRLLRGDPVGVRRFLRHWRTEKRAMADDDLFF